jgi:phosphoenolpyruvate carboxykinase (ATP)
MHYIIGSFYLIFQTSTRLPRLFLHPRQLQTRIMVHQSTQRFVHTPYITPHILHHNYAANANAPDTHSNRMFYPFFNPHCRLTTKPLVIGRDLEYFSQAGFDMDKVELKRNAPPAQLYEDAIRNEGAIISSSGALINFSGKKTGRSPKDKRIVYEETSRDEIWWGPVNIKIDER